VKKEMERRALWEGRVAQNTAGDFWAWSQAINRELCAQGVEVSQQTALWELVALVGQMVLDI